MKQIFSYYCFTVWMLFAGLDVFGESQTLDFVVYKGNDQIGTLSISRIVNDTRTTYSLTSSVTIDMLVDFRIIENITDVFDQGTLTSSRHTRHVNGTLRASNKAERYDHRYKLTNTNAEIRYMEDPIELSILSLYFHEPVMNQEIYSQNFQQLLVTRKTKAHTYTFDLPNGNVTTYSYKLGKLSAVESNTRFGVIKFIPVP